MSYTQTSRASHDLPSDSDDDDDENLEVLPPKAPVSLARQNCSLQEQHVEEPGRRRRGPRLSASGGDESDPIALLDDDDESGAEDASLAERLSRKKRAAAATASSSSAVVAAPRNQQPAARAAQPALANKTKATTSLSIELSDNDDSSHGGDDESKMTQKPSAIRPPVARRAAPSRTLKTDELSFSSDDDSCSSEDSLAKRIQQMAQPRSKKATVNKAVSRSSKNPPLQAAATKTTAEDTSVSLSQSSSPTTTAAVKSRRKQLTAAAEKQQKQREKEAERLRKQQEQSQAKALKEQEKLAKKRAREAKLEAERTEKRRRQELKDDNKQQKGGFANQEIVVFMDPGLFRHPELTIADELQDLKYNVIEHASMLGCNTIQYIRKDLKRGDGGAAGAIAAMRAGDRNGYEHLPVVGVVFDNALDFLKLLERNDNEEDDYPKLEDWLRSFQAGWRAAWRCDANKQPRIILYLYRVTHALEQLWIDHKRSKGSRSSAPPSEEELKDAIAWLLIQFQIECVESRENDHLAMELNRLTRKLSDAQYQKAYSDLDVSQKLAPLCGADASLYAQAKDCWLRQIQQVPRVSFHMARTFVQHYPTGYSLWKAYHQDPSMTEDEKRGLLVDCFGDKTYAKLSDQIYQLMTSDNSNVLLV